MLITLEIRLNMAEELRLFLTQLLGSVAGGAIQTLSGLVPASAPASPYLTQSSKKTAPAPQAAPQTAAAVEAPIAAPIAQQAPTPSAAPAVTVATVKATMASKLNGGGVGIKKVLTLLKEYGVSRAEDLPADKLAEVNAKIAELSA